MEFILLEKKQGVLCVTLNRPEVFNSFNMGMAKELQTAIDEASTDDEIRAILLTGKGKAFCSGQDLKEATAANAPDLKTILTEQYNPLILIIKNCNKPIIAAVNGVAAGAGANLALACDIILASRSANFIQAFSKIGLIPDTGGTFFLPRIVGFQKAKALMMTGDSLSSQQAMDCGIVYKIFEDESFLTEAMSFAERIASMPTKALGYTKELLFQSIHSTLEDQLFNELRYQEKCGETEDFKEGINAFLEKRKPKFYGK